MEMRARGNKTARCAGMFLIAAIVLFATACTMGAYGSLKVDGEVSRVMESYQVLPDHRYYISGEENMPDGILAVSSGYSLETALWREVDMTPELLRRLVAAMNWEGMGVSQFPVGAVVLGPGGEKVGLWYSDIVSTTVDLRADGRLVVHTPAKVRTYRRDLRRSKDIGGD